MHEISITCVQSQHANEYKSILVLRRKVECDSSVESGRGAFFRASAGVQVSLFKTFVRHTYFFGMPYCHTTNNEQRRRTNIQQQQTTQPNNKQWHRTTELMRS
jgi:hypothetical protein